MPYRTESQKLANTRMFAFATSVAFLGALTYIGKESVSNNTLPDCSVLNTEAEIVKHTTQLQR